MANRRRFIPDDLGFGNTITYSGDRLINKDGSFNIRREGNSGWSSYHWLIEMPYPRFVLATAVFFVGMNVLFALVFMLVGIHQLEGVPEGSPWSDFLYAFFFSVQTFTTVGYGAISPVGITANMVASICALVGLVSFAIIAGLFFARFSQPQSHITFSKRAVLAPFHGKPSFQCRMVNRRGHKIVNLKAQLSMTWLDSSGPRVVRRFANLSLDRDSIVLFPLNWTLVHVMDAHSPLHGKTFKDLEAMQAEFLVMVTGYDESYNQVIHSDTSYICGEVVDSARFKPMFHSDAEGTILHLDNLDAIEVVR